MTLSDAWQLFCDFFLGFLLLTLAAHFLEQLWVRRQNRKARTPVVPMN